MALAKKMKQRFGTTVVAKVVYLFSSTIICLGLIMLIILIVHILIPYLRVLNYKRANCTLNHTLYTPSFNCSAEYEKSKIAEFPCLHVYMNFTDENNVRHTSLLLESEYNLNRGKPECSYASCARFKWENKKNVDKFKKTWAKKNTTYKCFYSPANASKLIALKIHNENQVMHCMLWPSFCMVFGTIVILIVYCFVGCEIWGPRIATVQWDKSLKRIEMEQEIQKRTVKTEQPRHHQAFNPETNGNYSKY